MLLVRSRCARLPAARPSGFTLIELMVVVALIGLMAVMGLNALSNQKPRQAISLAPKQLASALESTRSFAMANGRNTVFVLRGNDPAKAAECNGGMTDANCVRYWILEDVGTAFADAKTFDPTGIKTQTVAARGTLEVTASGDYVLETGVLPRFVHLGRHTGYVQPTFPETSALRSLTEQAKANQCSVCDGTPAPSAFVTFSPDGELLGDRKKGGEVFFLTAKEPDGRELRDTRSVVVLRPAGMVLDRLALNQ